MSRENIAIKLKQLRNRNELSVNDVVDFLRNNGINVTDKAIYAWESGRNQPDEDTFMALCDFYDVSNIMDEFGYKKKKPPTIPEATAESELLKFFNMLSEKNQDAAIQYVKFLAAEERHTHNSEISERNNA